MSSTVSTLCLFSAALCNIGSLDDSVFGNQQAPQQQATDQLVNLGTNLFNQGLAGFGLGQLQVNRQPAAGSQQQQNNKKPKQPHESPCPGKFRYVSNNNQQWKGVAKFPNINPDKETNLHIDFVLPRNVGQQVSEKKRSLIRKKKTRL